MAASTWRIPQIPVLRVPRSSGPANLFHIYYTPVFAPWRRDREYLTPNNIHYLKLMDSYQNMPQDTLRWQVVANTAVKEVPMAVMRERLRRRVREGFREGLKEMGYDSNGNVLEGNQAAEKSSKVLKGTLEIHCRGGAGLDCQFADIVNHCKSTVDAVRSLDWNRSKSGIAGSKGEWWRLAATSHRPLEREPQKAGI